jgi:O-antigen/teichoic acid export membrane protein
MPALLSKVSSFFARGLPEGFFARVGWQYLSTILGLLFGFAQSLMLGRALGSAKFGIIALCASYATIVFQCFELSLHEAVIKYVVEFWEAKDERRVIAAAKLALFADALTGLAALAAGLAIAPLIRAGVLQGIEYRYIVLGVLAVAFNNIALATSTGLLRLFNQFKRPAILTTTMSGLKLAVSAFGLFVLHWQVLEIMILNAAANLLSNVALATLAALEVRRHTAVRWSDAPISLLRPRLREIGKFVGTTYLFALSGIPMRDVDVAVLGAYGTLSDIGAYRIAKNFMQAIWTLSDPAFVVIYPELAKLWTRRDGPALRRFLVRMSLLGGSIVFGLCGATFIAVPWFIQHVLGSEFSDAGHVFRWMLWGALFWGPILWIHPLVTAAGKPQVTLVATAVAGAVTIGAYLVLVPHYGARGAAFAYALNTPIVMALAWRIGRAWGVLRLPSPEDASARVNAR